MQGREPPSEGRTTEKYKERLARAALAARRTTQTYSQARLNSPHALLSADSQREEADSGADMPPVDGDAASPVSEGEGDARRAGMAAASGAGREVTTVADERL